MGKRFTDEPEIYVLGQELLSGKYYSPHPKYLRRDGVLNISANRLYGSPHIITRKLTIDRIAMNNSTLVEAKNCRLGIYDSDDIHPKNLILDAGEVDISTTGFKTIVVDQQLNPGLYWFALVSDGAPNVYDLLSSYEQGSVVMGNEGTSIYFSPVGVYAAHTYGALPNTFAEITEDRTRCLNILYRLASLD